MLIFTATTSVLSGLQRAPSSFSGDEGFVISESSAPTIFSSTLDSEMVLALESFPQITSTSPEVFAFSSWNGVSFVLRGVDIERFNQTGPRFSEFGIAEPFLSEGVATAIVGARLAERMGVEMPCNISLVGSYSLRLGFVRAVGTFATGTSIDDEMLVSIDTARFLSGVQEDMVSIIRVSTSDPAWLSDILAPHSSRFTLYDLHASPALVAAGQPATLSVGVRNWGGEAGSATVTFSEGGSVLKEQDVRLNSTSSRVVLGVFTFDSIGVHTVEVSVSGDFPVTLYANISVVDQFLKVSCPSKVLLGSSFDVTVTKYSGEPASAFVNFLNRSFVTDSSGIVTLSADETGAHEVRANLSGFEDGVTSVRVVDPSEYPATFSPSVTSFSVSPTVIQSSEKALCSAVVENGGTQAGVFQAVMFDGQSAVAFKEIQLDGMGSYVWRIEYLVQDTGTHYLRIENITQSVLVEPWYADNPGIVQLVVRYGGSTSLSSAVDIPIYRAAKLSEGNIASALFAIGAISAVLSSLAITSIFSKEIHESRRRLGILRTVGAPNSSVRRLVFEQAFENGIAGSAIGLALGVIVADFLSRSDQFLLFGHELRLTIDTGFLLLVFGAALVICVCSALVSSEMAVRQTAIVSIRGTEEAPPERKKIDELLE